MEANRYIFDNKDFKEDSDSSNETDDARDEVHARFKGKKKCTVLFV